MDSTSNAFPESNKPKSKKLLIILASFCIVTILIVIGIVLFLQSKEETALEDTSQEDSEEIQTEDTYEEGDEILKQACTVALTGYPNWIQQTEVVYIENESAEPKFFNRQSPEDVSFGITSPANEGEELADIGLVDVDILAYTKSKAGAEKGIEIGIMQFGVGSVSATPVYTNDEIEKVFDASYFSDEKVLLFYSTNSDTIRIGQVHPANDEETLFAEFNVDTDVENYYAKAAVSPNSKYAYAIHNFEGEYQNSLIIIDLTKAEIKKSIENAADPVWIGGNNILFSSIEDEKNVLLYNLEDDEIYQISSIDSEASNFNYNPNNNGMIGYTLDGDAYVISCQTFETIAQYETSKLEAFTNDRTAIITANSDAMNGTGFWRFQDSWTVVLTDDMRYYSSRPMLATPLNRY